MPSYVYETLIGITVKLAPLLLLACSAGCYGATDVAAEIQTFEGMPCVGNEHESTIKVSCGLDYLPGAVEGEARAAVNEGHLGAKITLKSVGNGSAEPRGLLAKTNSQIFDTVRIDGLGGETGQGLLHLSFKLEASPQVLHAVQGPLRAQASSVFDLQALLVIAGQGFTMWATKTETSLYTEMGGIATNSLNEAYIDGVKVANAFVQRQVAVPFVFGEEFGLAMILRSYAYATAQGYAHTELILDVMNSFDWGGIQKVTLDGRDVAFKLSSESDIDWVSPVPEPSTCILAAGGIVVVLGRRTIVRNQQS